LCDQISESLGGLVLIWATGGNRNPDWSNPQNKVEDSESSIC